MQLLGQTKLKTASGPNHKIITAEKKYYLKIDKFDVMYSLALFGNMVFQGDLFINILNIFRFQMVRTIKKVVL